ncbi:MAG: universal stress protein [Haliscomenobacter sp.]|nr:universal stress protein [Haliscomenobacter sp.]
MSKIHKIFFPSDFSETAQNAFRYCLLLADAYGAEIHLLHVVYPEYEMLDLPVMSVKATRDKIEFAQSALSSFTELTLSQVKETFTLNNHPLVHQEVEVGAPAGVIAQVAQRCQPDLLVMGTKGEHNALERTLGSVTTGVVEQVHCPVLVIPEQSDWKPVRVAAYATNLSEADPYHVWKAAQLLEPFHPVMHVVHISNGKGEGFEPDANLAEVEEFFNRHENNTAALQITFHELEGASVTGGLENFIDYYHIDLLIMFMPHHNWLDRLFKPSNTRKMTLDTPVPLLLLKS